MYGIIEAPDNGWTDASTIASFAAAGLLLAAFISWELRTPHPMLQMSFFRNARFSAASAAITLVFFSLFGTVFLLTQHDSIGAAHAVAAGMGSQGAALLDAARSSYVDALGSALLIAVGVVLFGALVTLLFLPARTAQRDDVDARVAGAAPADVRG